MTNDEIIAAWKDGWRNLPRDDEVYGMVIRFTRAIIAAERERCARICENAHMSTHDTAMSPQQQCAYAIRAKQ